MSSTAAVEVSGPLSALRDALAVAFPAAEPSPAGTEGIFITDDFAVSTKWDDLSETLAVALINGEDPDQSALLVFRKLRPLLPYAMQVFAADSNDLLDERVAVSTPA